jgi:hypothetical protein
LWCVALARRVALLFVFQPFIVHLVTAPTSISTLKVQVAQAVCNGPAQPKIYAVNAVRLWYIQHSNNLSQPTRTPEKQNGGWI